MNALLTSKLTTGRAIALFGLSADPPTGFSGHAGIMLWCANHMSIAETASGYRGVDAVWVMPVYKHIFDTKQKITPYEHRLAMLRLACASLGHTRVPVQITEVERELYASTQARIRARLVGHNQNTSSEATSNDNKQLETQIGTIDVLRYLVTTYPDVSFYLVLGADAYADLRQNRWKESNVIDSLCTVVCLPRQGTLTVDELAAIDAEAGYSSNEIALHKLTHETGNVVLDDVSSSTIRASTNLDYLRRALQPQVFAYIQHHRLYAIGSDSRLINTNNI